MSAWQGPITPSTYMLPLPYHEESLTSYLPISIFFPTFLRYRSVQNAVLANCFCLSNISCLNLCDGFANVTIRVIIPLLFHGRKKIILGIDSSLSARIIEQVYSFIAVSVP